MDKKFIKLDKKYYSVNLDEKGMLLKEATQQEVIDEQFEKVVLLSDTVDISNNFLQEIVDDARTELVNGLKKNIKGTVLSMLGFSKGWSDKGWAKIEKELEKCIMLCANCHSEVHEKESLLC